jgi:hypothetical protein
MATFTATTLAIGEEGTTPTYGEEDPTTTDAIGEEDPTTSRPAGEEDGPFSPAYQTDNPFGSY